MGDESTTEIVTNEITADKAEPPENISNNTPEMSNHSGDMCAVRSVEFLMQFLNNGEYVDIPEGIWEDRKRILAEEDLQKIAGEQLPFAVDIERGQLTRENFQEIIDTIQSGSEVIVFGTLSDGTPHMFHLGHVMEDEHGQYFLSNQRGGNPRIDRLTLEASIPDNGFTIIVVRKGEEKEASKEQVQQNAEQPEPIEEKQNLPEIIHPEECTLIVPPQVYSTIPEASSYITDEIPEDGEIILLPYLMDGAQRFTREQFLKFLEHESEGVDGYGEEKMSRSVAISQIQINGRTVYAVLLSESIYQEDEQKTEKDLYRSSSLERLEQMLRTGFFQLPGRIAFRSKTEDVEGGTGRVILALKLPKEMYLHHPHDDGLVAVGFSPSAMGSLPKEMQDDLGDLLVYDSQTPTIVDSSTLQRQVLLWGSVAGMLIRIDPSYIDREHTLTVNRERIATDTWRDKKAVEELEKILVKS